jgi:hypothetical protein
VHIVSNIVQAESQSHGNLLPSILEKIYSCLKHSQSEQCQGEVTSKQGKMTDEVCYRIVPGVSNFFMTKNFNQNYSQGKL